MAACIASRRFFYAAHEVYCAGVATVAPHTPVPADVCDRALRALACCLARGAAAHTTLVAHVSPTFATVARLTLAEHAVYSFVLRAPRAACASLVAMGLPLSPLSRVLLWARASHAPSFAGILLPRRIELPGLAVGAILDDAGMNEYCLLRIPIAEAAMRRAYAATRRAIHARNVLLGGRGPAAPGGACGVYVPVDVWREIFTYVVVP